MKEKLEEILIKVKEKLKSINDENALNNLRSLTLGKKSEISSLMANFRDLPVEDRKEYGKLINEQKQVLEELFEVKRNQILAEKLKEKLAKEEIDVTIPGAKLPLGSSHILNQVIKDFERLFIGMGYEIKDGPEVEKDLYNFEMLNLEKGHPARAMQDSFYIDLETLLRTHTSPVQARTMLKSEGKPIQIICPGKVYRRDDDDQYHSHQFMQIEGLVVGKNITMSHLKATLLEITKFFFGEDKEIRLRPSYFPFTEPSVEVDVYDGTSYIEILGAGMVHPNVLKMGGYDPNEFTGFAFGIGVERVAMLKYGIDDIRLFYTNDVRFLKQYKGGL
ncbi:MAG: phenylalanine--tRNA ligase subunit alpha [Acholeplasmataceae bacterium]|jgi:phenylalanyl-tRNA synthetase alpha chain|nr:phenylalanine--tRNA ligase subunit alpha [Acholeplasmataceae bacterium]